MFFFLSLFLPWLGNGFFRGETDESIGTIADTRMNHQYPQTCFGSSEYELALILKELRWITDQVRGKKLLKIIQKFLFFKFNSLIIYLGHFFFLSLNKRMQTTKYLVIGNLLQWLLIDYA